MLNNKGYSIKEMVVLCGVLAVLFGFGIAKTSYAFEDAISDEHIVEMQEKNLLTAAEIYVKENKDKFQEKETFIYGKELIENNLLLNDDNLSNVKIKITQENEEYKVEISN